MHNLVNLPSNFIGLGVGTGRSMLFFGTVKELKSTGNGGLYLDLEVQWASVNVGSRITGAFDFQANGRTKLIRAFSSEQTAGIYDLNEFVNQAVVISFDVFPRSGKDPKIEISSLTIWSKMWQPSATNAPTTFAVAGGY